jgi:hypothetical protein
MASNRGDFRYYCAFSRFFCHGKQWARSHMLGMPTMPAQIKSKSVPLTSHPIVLFASRSHRIARDRVAIAGENHDENVK